MGLTPKVARNFLLFRVYQPLLASFCCCSVAQSCPTLWTPWTAARQASPSITNSQSLLKLTSIQLVMPSNHLTLCRPLLLPPSVFPSIRDLSKESALRIRGPKYWSFSFSNSPFNEYSGLISFQIDWFDLLAVQGTLKSLLQHLISNTCSLMHVVQLRGGLPSSLMCS